MFNSPHTDKERDSCFLPHGSQRFRAKPLACARVCRFCRVTSIQMTSTRNTRYDADCCPPAVPVASRNSSARNQYKSHLSDHFLSQETSFIHATSDNLYLLYSRLSYTFNNDGELHEPDPQRFTGWYTSSQTASVSALTCCSSSSSLSSSWLWMGT